MELQKGGNAQKNIVGGDVQSLQIGYKIIELQTFDFTDGTKTRNWPIA
ncbi:MAG TPA: hypothetical protein VFZ42_08795 [Chitinophagaceae bacterium]